jgi:hypothetical protein
VLKFWHISFRRVRHTIFKAAGASAFGQKDEEAIGLGKYLNPFLQKKVF